MADTFAEFMSQTEAVAVFLCARSPEHTAGTGTHNAAEFGPCSLHTRMAMETADLVGYQGLMLQREWKVQLGPVVQAVMGANEDAARRLLETECEDTSLLTRLSLFTRSDDGPVLSTPWEPTT